MIPAAAPQRRFARFSAAVDRAVRETLAGSGLEWSDLGGGRFTVELPGERKLRTTCRLEVGSQALGIHAFVARHRLLTLTSSELDLEEVFLRYYRQEASDAA